MLYIVIGFLMLSLLLYLILGGADFGAGIVELFSRKKNKERTRQLTYQAIGPIWEANHMWLIIVIVILFVGFPLMYSEISTHLHIPIVLLLLGIIARGTAFIYRHYDAVKDDWQHLYNGIFVYSSFITPMFLGVLAGTLFSGKLTTGGGSFWEVYMAPWVSPFPFAVGLFTVGICGFLAAMFLIGEAHTPDQRSYYVRKARLLTFYTLVAGATVFAASSYDGLDIHGKMFQSTVSIAALSIATLAFILSWVLMRKVSKTVLRLLAGIQVTMILGAYIWLFFPHFVIYDDGTTLSLLEHHAAQSSLSALGWALIIGSLFIIPALVYLVYSFQKNPFREG